MEGVLNGYVTNPNQINKKIQKETTLEIDQIT
jgi:hypothetical protein